MQKPGYEDRQLHCGLGHTSRGLQRGTWHKVEDSPLVAVRRNSQIFKRDESDRMQHRKLRHRGSSYQTESCTIHWILVSQGKLWVRTRSGGHHDGSVQAIHRRIRRKRCILLDSTSWGGPKQGIIRSQPTGNHNVFTSLSSLIIRNIPIVRSVRRQKQHEPGVERNLRSAWTGLHFLQHLEPWSRRITKFWPMKTSRDADTKTL